MADVDLSKYKDLYVKTAREYVAQLESGMAKLATEHTPEIIGNLHIAAHSLKGQSLAMGYTTTGNLCMLLEHLFHDAATDGSKLTNNITIVNESVVQLKNSIDSIENNTVELDVSEVGKKLHEATGVE